MDYTTLARVKAEARISKTTDDALLSSYLIPAASRAIDEEIGGRLCANYFELADYANEGCRGQVDVEGNLVCWPLRAVVNSVSVLQYRFDPYESWQEFDTSHITLDGFTVKAWTRLRRRGQAFVQVSYNGGYAVSASPGSLPAVIQEAATVLTIRYYREAESGLSDAIGMAELGTFRYTVAMPARVKQMLMKWIRPIR